MIHNPAMECMPREEMRKLQTGSRRVPPSVRPHHCPEMVQTRRRYFQSRKFCPLCGADDHVLDDHCEYCGEIGHDEDDCPYAPPDWDDH